MSTEVEDILKNAQTAEFKQSMFEEDLENLSLLEDSRDSYAFNATLDDSQPGYALVCSMLLQERNTLGRLILSINGKVFPTFFCEAL